MRAKQIRNDTMYVYTGTWKEMTMLKTGRMNGIADEMLKTQLQIL
jgi:hypothetical protein